MDSLRDAVLALALAWALSTAPVSAQPRPDTPIRLTLTDALRRAAEDPPAIRQALARVAAARSQVDVARAGYYPSVSFGLNGNGALGLSGSFARNEGPQFVMGIPVGTGRTETANDSSSMNFGANSNVTGRIPIWDFGRTANAVEAAERAAEAAGADSELARVQAMGAVGSAYLTVLSDLEAVAAARAILTQREAQLQVTEGLVASGVRPPIERTRAQMNLEVARLDLTRAEGRMLNDRLALAAALGLDPLRAVEVAPVDDDTLAVDDDPSRAAEVAVRTRPELAAARLRVAQAEAQLAAARAAGAPSLTAQVSASAGTSFGASSNDSQTNGRVIPTSTNGTESVQGGASLGLSLTWPAFDPTVRANVRVAEANVTTARASLAQQSLQVRTAAAQAALAARVARLALEQAERLAATAAANLDQATGRYQSGTAPSLEIVDAQAADASARAQVITARLAWQMARVNLLAATGEILRLLR
jgi:outer membrane protein TolC